MCQDSGHGRVPTVEAVPEGAGFDGEVLAPEPVDEVSILTVRPPQPPGR